MIEGRSLLEREKSLKILKIMENHRFVFYLPITIYIYKTKKHLIVAINSPQEE